MKLSIVTINRNNAAGLRATLESTLGAQSGYDDWEQIIVDGASSDGSFSEVDRYCGDPRLGWCVSEPDSGIYNAMNKGAAHARGDYLLFLNSGDTLLPNILAKVFADPWEADIAYGDIWVEKCDRATLRSMDDADELTIGYLFYNSLPHQATFFARSLHERIGGYDESLRVWADRKFCLRAVFECHPSIKRFPFAISCFAWGGISSNPEFDLERRLECEETLAPFFGRYAAHRVCLPDPKPRPLLDKKTDRTIRGDPAFRSFLRGIAKAAHSFYLEKPNHSGHVDERNPADPDDQRLAIEFLDAAAVLRGHPRVALFVRHTLHWLANRLRRSAEHR